MEGQARKDLESEGCPPCYTANLGAPLRDVPEEYRQIISYWKSFAETGNLVLCTQLSDWERFRKPQRERAQQDQLESWTEFQNPHLQIREKFDKQIEYLKEELAAAERKSGPTEDEDDEAALQSMVESTRCLMERHQKLLVWIEQEGQRMLSIRSTPDKPYRDDDDGTSEACSRSSRKVLPKAGTFIGGARVSKAKSRKRSVPGRKTKVPETHMTTVGSTRTSDVRRTNAPLIRGTRENKTQGSQEEATALRQPSTRGAPASKGFGNPRAKSTSRQTAQRPKPTSTQTRPKRLRNLQQPRTAVPMKTKSARVSRQPQKWRPDAW